MQWIIWNSKPELLEQFETIIQRGQAGGLVETNDQSDETVEQNPGFPVWALII